jgi:hypothetical protein
MFRLLVWELGIDSFQSVAKSTCYSPKRLCFIHRAPPIAGWLIEFGSLTQRLGSIPLSGTSQLLRAVPPLSLRFRILALVVLPLVASPFASESQVPTFRSTASLASSGHLSCRMPLRP